MKPILCMVVFLGLLGTFSAQAQRSEVIDSLLEVYKTAPDDTLKLPTINYLFNHYLWTDPKEAFKYAKIELELANKLNHEMGAANAIYHHGVYYYNQGNKDSATYYYNQSLDHWKKTANLKGQVLVNNALSIIEHEKGNYEAALELVNINLAHHAKAYVDSTFWGSDYEQKAAIYASKGNYKIALENCLRAYELYEGRGNELRKADILTRMGELEQNLENYHKCIEYNQEAITIYKAYDDKWYWAQSNNFIGNAYYHLKDYTNSESYLKEGLKLSKEVNSEFLEGFALNVLGKISREKSDHRMALDQLQKSLELHQGTQDENSVLNNLLEIGITYQSMENYEQALNYLDEAIQMGKQIGASKDLAMAYYQKSLVEEQLGKPFLAIKSQRTYKSLSDSVYNIRKSQQIEEMRAIFDTEKKEQEIALQKKEIESLEQKAQISSLQRILFGTGLALSLGVLGFGFYGFRQKIKRSKVEKEKVDAELAFKKKELTTHALHLAKKNEVLEDLKQKAQALKEKENSKNGYQQLINAINLDLKDDNNWDSFARYFEQVHKDFNSKVLKKYPDITSNELRLMALIKMNLSSKEMANMLNISINGIKKARQRLRKKMDLATGASLENAVLSI